MKKIISYLISAIMIFTMVPSIAFAGTAEQQAADELAVHSELDNVQYEGSMKLHIEQTNPLYGGYSAPVIETLDAGAINEDENAIAPNGAAGAEYAATVDEAAEFLRAQMVDRQTSVTISMPVTEADLTNEAMTALTSKIFTSAMKHTGKVNEGDSLQWVWQDQYTDITVTGDASGLIATITYTIIYYTTAEQEAALSEAVAALKAELNLDGKSDYEKVKAIYDYMTANISYDYEHYGDDSYKLQYTAFAALVNKTSVCQGYATLFYRMMCEYGIDARMVAGTSINVNGEPEGHSWNIVKFGDKYYNLDATWDSTWDEDKSKHDFFLRGTAAFENHTRNAEFTTDEFNAEYPVSVADYVPGAESDDSQEGDGGKDPEEPCKTHSYSNWIIEKKSTCIEIGSKYKECIVCGNKVIEEIGLAEHTPGEKATCENAQLCIVCSEELTPVLPHNLIKIDAVKADCESAGNIEYYTCSECSKLYSDADGKTEVTRDDTIISATGHKSKTVVKKATVSKSGYVKEICEVCEQQLSYKTIQQIKTVALKTTKYVYNGSVKKPTVSVKNAANASLKINTDYTVKYTDSKGKTVTKPVNVGTYYAVITFKGNYSGSAKKSFTINPKPTSLNKVTAGKKQLTASWSKQTKQVTGYEIQYSTTKNFTKNTTQTLKIKNYKTNTKTIKNLKSKKNYWVKVRTYKTVSGKTYYSAWSDYKTVKTK